MCLARATAECHPGQPKLVAVADSGIPPADGLLVLFVLAELAEVLGLDAELAHGFLPRHRVWASLPLDGGGVPVQAGYGAQKIVSRGVLQENYPTRKVGIARVGWR
mgnify:CR=1 FL=1